jgi:dolichol-phosphate mannosyltransferase
MDKRDACDISIIVPALNEEENIASVINSCLRAIAESGLTGEIIAVDDGSRDSTAGIIKGFLGRGDPVGMISHARPQGVGACFWDGVSRASGRAVVFIPGDGENDPREILRYYARLKDVDMVIPYALNKHARTRRRQILSRVFRYAVNALFAIRLNYTNGTVLYRKAVLEEAKNRETGFFFQADILIRLLKKRHSFAEVPYRIGFRKKGKSKLASFQALLQVVIAISRLWWQVHISRRKEYESV